MIAPQNTNKNYPVKISYLVNTRPLMSFKLNRLGSSSIMIKSKVHNTFSLDFNFKVIDLNLQKTNNHRANSRGPLARKKRSLRYFTRPLNIKKIFVIGKNSKALKDYEFKNYYTLSCNGVY